MAEYEEVKGKEKSQNLLLHRPSPSIEKPSSNQISILGEDLPIVS